MLEIRNLNKNFKKNNVLNNINLKLDNGIYGLLGTNGAGKTTFLRCLTLLYKEGYKSIYINNVLANNRLLNKIGYLPQQFGLFNELTIFESMQLIANFKGMKKVEAIEDINKCLELVNLIEEKNKSVKLLSGGMVRRLGIAQALLNNPEIIIFDEPTAGLDPMERLRFKSIISKIKKNKIVIISTHIVEDIEAICDYVIIMDHGDIKGCMLCAELQKHAEGKVFEIPEDDLKKAKGIVCTEKTYERDGLLFTRVLSDQRQDYPTCQTNIEDGYLCVINGI